MVVNLTRKKFDRYWDMIDVDKKDWDVEILKQKTVENLSDVASRSWPKGAVTFDDFCELLDFEDMPDEILQKCSGPLVVAVSIAQKGI